MRVASLLTAALCAAPALASGDDVYEWAGVFDVSDYKDDGFVQWIAQKVDGDYADPKMGFVIFAETGAKDKTLEDSEEAAEALLEGTCVKTPINVTLAPSTSTCYNLFFDRDSFESVWKLDVSNTDYISFWAQHVPTEFEDTTHYLRALDGTDIEPIHELPEEEVEETWGYAILACILVWLMTFCGVALIGCKVVPGEISPSVHAGLSAFAAGALLSCALYLIFPEGLYLIGTGTGAPGIDDEMDDEAPWKENYIVFVWGSAFISGYLISLIMFLVDPTADMKKEGGAPAQAIEGGAPATEMVEKGAPAADLQVGDVALNELSEVEQQKNRTMLFAICAGDFFHNLVDGFAIGFAFKICNPDEAKDDDDAPAIPMAWGILLATMYHEIAQEVGDFVLLTHDIGLSTAMALLWNFAAGSSVLLGGLIATGVEISDVATGVLLAFGGGTYVYLSTTEAMPRALRYSEQLEDQSTMAVKKHYGICFAAFLLGAILIAVILPGHEHCSADGGHAH